MNCMKQRRQIVLKTIAMAMSVVLGIGALSVGAAFADDHRERERGRRERAEHRRYYHRRYATQPYVVSPPPVVYAAPPTVYSPPPVVYAPPPPSPGISIVFPIHIR